MDIWIARDKDGRLFVYEESAPTWDESCNVWFSTSVSGATEILPHLVRCVKPGECWKFTGK